MHELTNSFFAASLPFLNGTTMNSPLWNNPNTIIGISFIEKRKEKQFIKFIDLSHYIPKVHELQNEGILIR